MRFEEGVWRRGETVERTRLYGLAPVSFPIIPKRYQSPDQSFLAFFCYFFLPTCLDDWAVDRFRYLLLIYFLL